ncbi:MAG: hypothetical protein OEV42_07910 [Deltaproteobacteria bacterium]|nr:hypothetical protein [Deltaproteobacteria bacterium]
MQSDKGQISNNYFRTALLDGARPFLYRGRVRSLLGIPDSSGVNPALRATSIPPAFTYMNHPFRDDLCSAPYQMAEGMHWALSNENAAEFKDSIAGFQERVNLPGPLKKKNGSDSAFPETRPSDSSVNKGSQRKSYKKNKILQRNDVPEADREEAFVNADKKSGKAGAVLEGTNIDVPGFSEKGQAFSQIKPFEKAPILSEKNVKRRNEAPPPLEKVKTGSDKNVFGEEDKEKIASARPTSSLMQKKLQKEGATGEIDTKKQWARVKENSYGESPIAIRNIAGKTSRQNLAQQMGHLPTEVKGENDGLSRKVKPRSSQYAGMDRLVGSGGNSTEKIDRLRHAAHDLAYKVSSRQATADKEREQYESERVPSRQVVEQVVVVRQPSGRSRAPRAFWERSYLGRFNRMTLR